MNNDNDIQVLTNFYSYDDDLFSLWKDGVGGGCQPV
jgi:hypothetical protein